MAATFLKARSYETGKSLVEVDTLDTAADLMAKATGNRVRLLLPVDVLVADEISAEAKVKVVSIQNIPPMSSIVDIGPETIKRFSQELTKSKTIFWNGPMGIYEIPRFAEGTKSMARLLASLNATTVIGGGSSAEIVTEMKLADEMSFVSTGGGASLRFLGGRELPGLQALLNKKS